jgi:hypothetical protein
MSKFNPLGYRGVNLCAITKTQIREVITRVNIRMQVVKHVPTMHKTISIE